jgi:hypothetical protein
MQLVRKQSTTLLSIMVPALELPEPMEFPELAME